MAKVKPTLNEADLDLIDRRIDKKLMAQDARLNKKLDSLEDRFEKKLYEFRNDFFEKIDPILKEVLASREERSIIFHHVSELRTRVEKIEKHLGFAA